MAVSWLRRVAARAPVPVFAAVGEGAAARVDDLLLSPRLERVANPRRARVLLVAGEVRESDHEALRRIHDQASQPRATVWWGSKPLEGIETPVRVDANADPRSTIEELGRGLLEGERAPEPALLLDEPPVPWRGVGEHGQGGKGMMGGTPYGRAMAMTADDLRDGLALDAYDLRIGPFLPTLPAGLVLDLTLQGDMVQRARVRHPPFAQPADGAAAQAAQRLRSAACLLALLELEALALRLRIAARALGRGDAVDSSRLRAIVRRSGAFVAIPPALGAVGATDVRSRLHAWLDDGTRDAQLRTNATLGDLLRGLEWHEAMLVIASFGVDEIARMPRDAGDDAAAGRHAA